MAGSRHPVLSQPKRMLLGFTVMQPACSRSYFYLQTYVSMPRAYLHKRLNSDKQVALEVDLPVVPTYCTSVHITGWSWRMQPGLLSDEARLGNTCQNTPNALHPLTSSSKDWSSKAELIQSKTPLEMQIALILISHPRLIYSTEPLALLSGTLKATPATLCSHPSDCFHLLLLPGAYMISPQRRTLSFHCIQLQQLFKQGP